MTGIIFIWRKNVGGTKLSKTILICERCERIIGFIVFCFIRSLQRIQNNLSTQKLRFDCIIVIIIINGMLCFGPRILFRLLREIHYSIWRCHPFKGHTLHHTFEG